MNRVRPEHIRSFEERDFEAKYNDNALEKASRSLIRFRKVNLNFIEQILK